MDQLSAIAEILTNHGMSAAEAAETAASVVSALQASASDQATKVIDTIFDKAMSFWLITNGMK
jgi:hypothetical protein